jgi:hypothetical protein
MVALRVDHHPGAVELSPVSISKASSTAMPPQDLIGCRFTEAIEQAWRSVTVVQRGGRAGIVGHRNAADGTMPHEPGHPRRRAAVARTPPVARQRLDRARDQEQRRRRLGRRDDQAGEAEPALVGPWTMGRDKKNPKPLDTNAFNTLVKTASEVLRRHEQQLHAQLHKQFDVDSVTRPHHRHAGHRARRRRPACLAGGHRRRSARNWRACAWRRPSSSAPAVQPTGWPAATASRPDQGTPSSSRAVNHSRVSNSSWW